MLKLIIGVKGTGKTKTLIELVNNAVSASKGNVVCIEKGDKLIHDITYKARLIDTDELMDLLSLVRLGAVKGLINTDTAKIEGMMINLQPATISLSVDRPLDRNGRDALRAQRVREMLE